jgi:hypothetical protein
MALVITVSKVLRIRGCRSPVRNPVAALSLVKRASSRWHRFSSLRIERLSGQFHTGRRDPGSFASQWDAKRCLLSRE